MYSNEGMCKEIIISTLVHLNIYYDSKNVKNGWMKIRCPSIYHQDNSPSAGIHVGTGIISCFSCGLKTNLHKIVQQRFNCTYKEAREYIFGNRIIPYSINNDSLQTKNSSVPEDIKIVRKDQFVTVSFDPDDYYYTKIRGYTKEYCEQFGIELCYSYKYEDYMLIPIKDSKLGIDTFEARKLMLRERLISYYGFKSEVPPEELFKRIKRRNGYKYEEGSVIDKDGITHYDDNLIYFMKPKTLYPFSTAVGHTLFNIDNLDREEDLWIVEGSASLPKINLISNNSTCPFGSTLTDQQIKYLKEFKKNKYLIPDNDPAGNAMIERVYKEEVQDVYIILINKEDTDEDYIEEIKRTSPIPIKEFQNLRIYRLL